MDLQIPLNIFGFFSGLGITAAGIGFAYSQFVGGGAKAKDELIKTLKETATAEKATAERLAIEKQTIVSSHQQQLNELNEKVGKLQGLYEASENQKKEYLTILQGMSPDEIQYRSEMRKNFEGVAAYMKQSSDVLMALTQFMKSMNEGIKKNNSFNKEVEADTAQEEGKLLRKNV